MAIRKFLVGVVAFTLLIWGPIPAQPFGLWIRAAYLVAIPSAAWLALGWIWRVWQPEASAEDRLARTLAGAVAAALFLGAVNTAQQKYHAECTQYARTWDGQECVGDYKPAPGPDVAQVVLLAAAGTFAFWFGVRKQ